MTPELFQELSELLSRWKALANHARAQAEARPNSTYDGYMLGLEIASDDLTRTLSKTLKQCPTVKVDN
jgi:hypothetical protein